MAPRPDPRVERTRAKVLAAAHEVLMELGFGDVTIEDISARSGVARSTIYRHWDTKDEVLRDAFSSVALAPQAPGATLREDLRHYARAFADGLARSWGRAAATLAAAAVDDPAQRRIIATFRSGYVRDVETLMERAAARGESLRPTDPREVADRLVAPLFYRYLISHEPLNDAVADAEADRVRATLEP